MLARMRTLVVVPTYNEASGVEAVLRRIREELPEGHILVVDDNSPDGTGGLVEAMSAADPKMSLLSRPTKSGLGSAYLAGFTEGLARGFDILVEMDADLSHDPVALPALVSATTHGADLAIGSRYVAGSSIPDWTRRRAFLSRWGNRYAALALGLAVNDSTSGYRAYRADALAKVDLGHVRAYGYGFQVEMTYRLIRQGARVVEIPVAFVDRTGRRIQDVPAHRDRGVRAGDRLGSARRPHRRAPPPRREDQDLSRWARGRRPQRGRSSMPTWTPSSCRWSSSVGRSCRVGRWSSAALASAVS